MSDIAEELALRSSPAYLKAKGKELAVSKASQTRDKAMTRVSETRMDLRDSVREHPSLWSLAGGLAGLGISSLLVRRFKQKDAEVIDAGWRRNPQYGFVAGEDAGRSGGQYGGAGDGAQRHGTPDKVAWAKAAAHDLKEQGRDLKERGSSMAHDLKERGEDAAHHLKERGEDAAHHLKERGEEAAHHLKERRNSGSGGEGGSLKDRGEELKERGAQMFHEREAQLRERGSHMKQRVQEDPIPLVFGALAIGAIAAFLLPVSSRERELSEPLAGRLRGRVDTLKGEASNRLEQVREQASESFSSFREQATDTLKGHEEQHGAFEPADAQEPSMRH